MAQARAAERLRRLPTRWPTYALLGGSVIAILAVGLALPAAFGHPPTAAIATVPPPVPPLLPAGKPGDHDPRPPARYAGVSLVTSPAPPRGTVLAASDVGVTPTTITLGIILPGLGVIANFGIDVSQLDPKIQKTYWQSAIDRINAAGGIDGRRLVADYTTASILSQDSMRAACRTLTEDDKVFAVTNVLGITGDPILCVTRDHATPVHRHRRRGSERLSGVAGASRHPGALQRPHPADLRRPAVPARPAARPADRGRPRHHAGRGVGRRHQDCPARRRGQVRRRRTARQPGPADGDRRGGGRRAADAGRRRGHGAVLHQRRVRHRLRHPGRLRRLPTRPTT